MLNYIYIYTYKIIYIKYIYIHIFAKSLGLDERMECYSNQSTFITWKDHKVNFMNNTKCRLINSSKSEVGLVSKHYLSSIISTVAEKSSVNQWRNASTVIKWFENLKNKNVGSQSLILQTSTG